MMIDREHDLPITKQAEVLRISRSGVYYLPRSVSATDLEVMRRLDRLHLEFSFAGSRMLRGLLAAEGCRSGRRHVKTLMRRIGIEALYRRPRTTKPEPGYKIYPYLLRGMEITRQNQAWAMDITYIPMARDFVYLAVVLDWFSRRVLSWPLSITMEAAFCVETLENSLARHGKPEIFNTDQGSQFTGSAFTGVLANNDIAISMDDKGAWRDNVFVERLWRSKLPRLGNQPVGGLRVNALVARLVGIGQRRSPDRLAKAHVVELRGLSRQADLDIAQALSVGQLRERHRSVLLGTAQHSHPSVATVARNNPRKGALRQKTHELGEKRFADVYGRLLGKTPNSARPTSNRHRPFPPASYCQIGAFQNAPRRQPDSSENSS
jgi:putative transposase